jgi:hypothetical protein
MELGAGSEATMGHAAGSSGEHGHVLRIRPVRIDRTHMAAPVTNPKTPVNGAIALGPTRS